MQNFLSRLSILDRILYVVMALLILVLCFDLYGAVGALPCSVQVYNGCYPWGSEGPVAGDWFYKTKERYLIRGLIQVVFLLTALGVLARFEKNAKKTVSAIMLAVVPSLITWLLSLFLIS